MAYFSMRGFIPYSVYLAQRNEPPTQPAPVAPKPLLDSVYEQTANLFERMKERKKHWERVIAEATEELRQVNVTLAATNSMLGTLDLGRCERPATFVEAIEADIEAELFKAAQEAAATPHPLDM